MLRTNTTYMHISPGTLQLVLVGDHDRGCKLAYWGSARPMEVLNWFFLILGLSRSLTIADHQIVVFGGTVDRFRQLRRSEIPRTCCHIVTVSLVARHPHPQPLFLDVDSLAQLHTLEIPATAHSCQVSWSYACNTLSF